ncbi:hypothetical protein MLD38_016475 [Melastoma candidum]|uniref:Uncharacterized protein n=1 Tax=Melastoma candidum TaxID=119954 RepID=A0ACB9QQM4_9MYRT|nr:hypothetical protein MLD38_016475 [Melastoma candidum]
MAKIKATVVLMKKNSGDLTDLGESFLDRVFELFGQKVSFQLVSAVHGDPENGGKGRVGKPAHLENWICTVAPLVAQDSTFRVTFDWDEGMEFPGAVLVRNKHHSEFYLRTITLEDVPGIGRVHFVCNSWVYPMKYYKGDRVFFSNKAYLPNQTPAALKKYREEELIMLRGDGRGELKRWDRVYDYAYYNDLADPDKSQEYARPVLGGSAEFPYPRRIRTSRKPAKSDPNTESRLPLLESIKIYVPADERLSHIKLSDILGSGLKSITQYFYPQLGSLLCRSHREFRSFREALDIYEGGIKLPKCLIKFIQKDVPLELIKEVIPTEGEGLLKYPMPEVLKYNKLAWMTDEEFAREMLAGINPVSIKRLREFPPTSKLDPMVYGSQGSSITEDDIESCLNGLSVREAIKKNKLFILDHHDMVMPYLRRINSTATKTYATRTLLFLQDCGTLKPVAIELSLPHPNGDQYGAINEVHTPADQGVEGHLWQLAKAYAAVNDVGRHQIISHWLLTHAVIEPFIIAANRQLSVLHPIYKLLYPHFRDTLNLNAFARVIVINAGGVLESTLYSNKYSMEMSSAIYKDWIFTEQALPTDLINRGMAIPDAKSPRGLRLVIEDYPYAVDGLEIWFAIKTWVEEYCSYYYDADESVQNDMELQVWWKELREQGHGDKKDELWWPKMHTVRDLKDICTIMIWVASALHAAVNFGQYHYGGYMPSRPTTSRRFMPKEGTPEYEELNSNPERVFLETITPRKETLLGLSLIGLLSRHSTEEVYLGQTDTPDWTVDKTPLESFKKFTKKIEEIKGKILQMNSDPRWNNRVGLVNIPYMFLYPQSGGGITGKGVPNSISM